MVFVVEIQDVCVIPHIKEVCSLPGSTPSRHLTNRIGQWTEMNLNTKSSDTNIYMTMLMMLKVLIVVFLEVSLLLVILKN